MTVIVHRDVKPGNVTRFGHPYRDRAPDVPTRRYEPGPNPFGLGCQPLSLTRQVDALLAEIDMLQAKAAFMQRSRLGACAWLESESARVSTALGNAP